MSDGSGGKKVKGKRKKEKGKRDPPYFSSKSSRGD
jgi:hypothetical protein